MILKKLIVQLLNHLMSLVKIKQIINFMLLLILQIVTVIKQKLMIVVIQINQQIKDICIH